MAPPSNCKWRMAWWTFRWNGSGVRVGKAVAWGRAGHLAKMRRSGPTLMIVLCGKGVPFPSYRHPFGEEISALYSF